MATTSITGVRIFVTLALNEKNHIYRSISGRWESVLQEVTYDFDVFFNAEFNEHLTFQITQTCLEVIAKIP